MPKALTADQAAIRIMLGPGTLQQKQAKLTALTRGVEKMAGLRCPECDGKNIDDNGARRTADLTYLCTSCGFQWDAENA